MKISLLISLFSLLLTISSCLFLNESLHLFGSLSSGASKTFIIEVRANETKVVSVISKGNGTYDLSLVQSHDLSASHLWRNKKNDSHKQFLCLFSSSNKISLSLFTFEVKYVSYSIHLSLQDIQIKTNTRLSTFVSKNHPFVSKFEETSKSLKETRYLITVKSNDTENLAIAAIQSLTCPFITDELTIRLKSKWQTFNGLAALDLRFSPMSKIGFYIVVTSKSKNPKDIIVEIETKDYDPLSMTLIVISLYVLICLTVFTISTCCFVPVEGKIIEKMKGSLRPRLLDIWYPSKNISVPESIELCITNEREMDELDGSSNLTTVHRSTSMTHFEFSQYREILIFDKTEIKKLRAKKTLTLQDLALECDIHKFPTRLHTKSSLYVWILLLMGVFYSLPVFQLVKNTERIYTESGNYNLCYYNYLCKVSWGHLEDYGHFLSNIGYVISGLFFNVMTLLRRLRYNALLKSRVDKRKGIPEQYGVFFALGSSLILEGLLSGAYHICPTSENFQFDTTFMYVLSFLVFCKVYQFRHPDITAKAYKAFSLIGLVLIFEVIGVYMSNSGFWIVFLTSYIIVAIFFIVQTYYNGIPSQFLISTQELLMSLCKQGQTRSPIKEFSTFRRGKLLSSLFIALINIGLAGYFSISRKPGVSRYLLLILMVNMGLYVSYYISNKLYYRYVCKVQGEELTKVCILYACLSTVVSAGALYFFYYELKDSSMSPSESRQLNAPCTFYFFDNHDIWHFLSSAALFFNFMVILTLEDNNLDTSWNDIPVF